MGLQTASGNSDTRCVAQQASIVGGLLLVLLVLLPLQVGVAVPPAARFSLALQECSSVSAAAAAQLRGHVGSVGNWRGALRSPIRAR